MKNLKLILSLLILTLFLSCSRDENDTDFINNVNAPTDITALFTITQDNSGNVTVRPNGTGVTSYSVDFGDLTLEIAEIGPGETATHKYAEGVYDVTITAKGINGKTTTINQQVTVAFVAPDDLAVTAIADVANPYIFNITATALYETYFEVYFGEDPNQIPVQFNEGQTITHTYAATGTYTIRVVAFSGGVATSEQEVVVSVFDPLLMPVDFESATLNYNFNNFGGAVSSVVDNPSPGGINSSAKVGMLNKTAGAEVWAGSFIELSDPIDFSSLNQISVKTFSPVAGITVKMKLENSLNANINTEVDVTNTVANGWETLTFSFPGVVNANNYQKVVLFFDFGNNGNGANYYFDDIQLSSSAPDVMLIDFQSGPYVFSDFGNATTTVIANPDASGVNTSTQVAKQVKNSGAEVWAGSFIELAAPINFAAHTKMKLKIWSPVAGAVIKLKLENSANASIATEKDATTTVANAWEELTYDFTGIVNANNYQKVVVFCNFGVAGNNATYYFDDIKLSN